MATKQTAKGGQALTEISNAMVNAVLSVVHVDPDVSVETFLLDV